MKEFLSGSVCKRAVLDKYMDGDRERKTCRAGEQFCDVCCGRRTKRVRVVEQEVVAAEKRARIEPDGDAAEEI